MGKAWVAGRGGRECMEGGKEGKMGDICYTVNDFKTFLNDVCSVEVENTPFHFTKTNLLVIGEE